MSDATDAVTMEGAGHRIQRLRGERLTLTRRLASGDYTLDEIRGGQVTRDNVRVQRVDFELDSL